MASHNELGKKGEEIAADFLRNKGYQILEINWRHQYLEVDLIALYKNLLVLIEVKTRSDLKFGLPLEAVTRKKEKNLIDAAEKYLEIKHLDNEVRFDIISVIESENSHSIRHIEDAFNAWS